MDENRLKMEILGDTTLEQAYQTYSLLTEEIKRWQAERGSFWREEISPAKTPPYYPLADFPEMVVFEVWQRLNRVIGVLVPESGLRKTWNDFKDGQPASDPKLSSSLQITLSGIAQLLRVKAPLTKTEEVSKARCPICGEEAVFSVLTPPNGQRYLHCTLCGHEWPTTRVGCIRCGSEEASAQNYLKAKEFPGIEVVACEACGQYFKELDLRLLSVTDYLWEDVRTLSLNYAAEQWLAEHTKVAGKLQ